MDSFLSNLREIQDAASKEFAVGGEESRQAMFEARKSRGQSVEGPKFAQMVDAYRTSQALKAATGAQQDPVYKAAREKAGIGFDVDTRNKKIGTILGALGADLTQDSARRFYWLLNAAQATGDMIAETAISRARPVRETEVQGELNLFPDAKKEPKKFQSDLYKVDRGTGKRKYGPGLVQLAAVPAGIAINTGLGLMTPFGGAEGYKAALPSEDDPSKTSNVLGEVAMKYIMGSTGNLLPYDEFVKVRPDVSKEEYGRYKAFKHDKPMLDLNPFDDGQMGVMRGALKTTDEGIHGPEVQFLGRSLPMTTGIIPFLGAVGGAAAGVSHLGPDKGLLSSKRPIRRGLGGGLAGLAAGQIIGNIIEQERRRRNTAENAMDGTLS